MAYQHSLVGSDLSRLMNMTDGVFGFAITFLVVNLVVPITCEAGHEESCLVGVLGGDGYAFLAYVLSFFVIGIWWVRHHGLFKFIVRYNAWLLWTNMVFLLTIALTPFILGLLADFFTVQIAVIIFGVVEAAAGFLLIAVWQVAASANLLSPEATPEVVAGMRAGMFIAPVIFLLSAGIAVFSVLLAHIVWIGLLIEIAYSQLFSTKFRYPSPPAEPVPSPPAG